MSGKITLTAKNSNEIYVISFPQNLLKFINYDFTPFLERCIDLCRVCMKQGVCDRDEIAALRNSVGACHRYVDKNIHGVYEKIVIDCWIEYICRQNEISAKTLWNSFASCKNDFEKTVFARLCDLRYGKAVNQWVNLLRIQEYAQKKTDFVFGQRIEKNSQAATRACYFDLMFLVAANEMGYETDALGGSKVYTTGRTPNSPFIMNGVSREILRNVLIDIKYDEGTPESKSGAMSDQAAMDAFAAIKNLIPEEQDIITDTILKTMSEQPQKIYIPESLKAAVDLEVDMFIESGAVLQRCLRCNEYFQRDDNYDYDYCDHVSREGRTCLEAMSQNGTAPRRAITADASVLQARCDQLYKEMAERVNVDMTQRDFSDWYKFMLIIRENVLDGAATMEDFENFVEYSHEISFPAPNRSASAQEEQPRKQQKREETRKRDLREELDDEVEFDELGREVKPFVFEKLNRSEIPAPQFSESASSAFSNSRSDVHTAPAGIPYPYAGYYPPPIYYAQPPVNHVIRGVIKEEAVLIPNGDRDKGKQVLVPKRREHEDYREYPDYRDSRPRREVKPIPPQNDDDIKIYGAKEPVPEKREEFVKVYQSSKSAAVNPERKPQPAYAKPERADLLTNPFLKNLLKTEDEQEESRREERFPEPLEQRDNYNDYDDYNNYDEYDGDYNHEEEEIVYDGTPPLSVFMENGGGYSPKSKAVNAYKSLSEPPLPPREAPQLSQPKAPREPLPLPQTPREPPQMSRETPQIQPPQLPPRETPPPDLPDVQRDEPQDESKPLPLLNLPKSNPSRRPYPRSVRTENPGLADFADILKGMERKDGFGDDDENPPVSHKTKRVMDIIFGRSKSNPLVAPENAPENAPEDEDYE